MSGKNKKTKKQHETGPSPNINEPLETIKQNSHYAPNNQAAPLNDNFWNGKSNPLSSKGN